MKITYSGSTLTLTVFLDGTAVLTAPVDLSTLGLDPGGKAVVGFTAATGSLDEYADILSWSFTGT